MSISCYILGFDVSYNGKVCWSFSMHQNEINTNDIRYQNIIKYAINGNNEICVHDYDDEYNSVQNISKEPICSLFAYMGDGNIYNNMKSMMGYLLSKNHRNYTIKYGLDKCIYYPYENSLYFEYSREVDYCCELCLVVEYSGNSIFNISSNEVLCVYPILKITDHELLKLFYEELQSILTYVYKDNTSTMYDIITGNKDKFIDICDSNFTQFHKPGKSLKSI